MKKTQLDNFVDASPKGRITQARKLTKLGVKAKDALGAVDMWTEDRLIGKKLSSRTISDYIKYDAKMEDKPKKENKNTITMTEHEGDFITNKVNIVNYKPFEKLFDKETTDTILSGKGKVNKTAKSFYNPSGWGKSGEVTSLTTGKTYNDISDVYKEEDKILSKTVNKKPSMDKKLRSIPVLWHVETNSSEASNGGSCQISARTYLDWVKKHGPKSAENNYYWNENELKEFAEMSKVHQNDEYNNYKNYRVEDGMRAGKNYNYTHSGISGSVPVTSNTKLQERFKYYSRKPLEVLTALKGDRSYLASIKGHAYTITKEGNKYSIATTEAPFWSNSKTQWLNKAHNPEIFIDPNELSDSEKDTVEFLKKRWNIRDSNVWKVKPRTEEEKSKIRKQVDVNSTKARN